MSKDFNFSPVEQGNAFREADEAIRATVKNRVSEGLSSEGIVQLRQEFETALEQSGRHLSPADQGSFLGVFDRALESELKARAQGEVLPPVTSAALPSFRQP